MPQIKTRPFFTSIRGQLVCLLVAGFIFWIDSFTPLGFHHGSLYFLVLVPLALSSHERTLIAFAGLCIALTLVGFFISPSGIDRFYALANRLISVLEIAAFAGVSVFIRRQLHARHHVNAEIRQLAERQISILESITDAFVAMDADWHISYMNREAERLLQSRREDLLGRVIWDFFPGAENFKMQYERVIAEQVSATFEEYYPGMEVWFEVRAFPAEHGGVLVYFRDVTTAHFHAEEMRQARERFEILSRATTDAVWDWNLVTDQMWWNDSMYKLFGYEQGTLEADSRSWTSHIHPEDKARVLDDLHEMIRSSESDWDGEYRFQRCDGTYVYVHDKGHIIRDPHGKAVRMIGGMVDTTEHRLLRERLAQSERLEALGQLTGGVAHDFNNLLTVIIGNGELLAEGMQHDHERLPLIDLINQAATRASSLTRHLLAFARKQALAPEVTDIKQLLNGMKALLQRALMSNIEINLAHSDGLWLALVDASQLENAVLNLCLNARDAMSEGGRLTIETSNAILDHRYAAYYDDVLPGKYVAIAVTDNGCGMTKEILQQVFDPFFSTKEPGKGTGLGLSMVYGFVKQSKGHINIYSKPGRGTTLRLYLPVAVDAKVESAPVLEAPPKGGNDVILLVEDDEMVNASVLNMLSRTGYQVLSARNGHDALRLLQENSAIKLLFTDIIMPGGMNGRQLAESACQLRPELKVLFTSGYNENTIMHDGRLDAGVNLLSKPYQSKELLYKLRQLLGDANE